MTDVLNDPDYYRRRREQELALADKATDPDIADIHRRMAARYAEHYEQAVGPALRVRA